MLAWEVATLAQQTPKCLALGGPRRLPAVEIDRGVEKSSRHGLKRP